jgi:hypothetical protein
MIRSSVADLTVDEFKSLLREVVAQTILEALAGMVQFSREIR